MKLINSAVTKFGATKVVAVAAGAGDKLNAVVFLPESSILSPSNR